jgi:hypothetical protein
MVIADLLWSMSEVNLMAKKEFPPPRLVKFFSSLNDVSGFTGNEYLSELQNYSRLHNYVNTHFFCFRRHVLI